MNLGGFGNSVDDVLTVELPAGTTPGMFAVLHVTVEDAGSWVKPAAWLPLEESPKGTRFAGLYYQVVGDVMSWDADVMGGDAHYTVTCLDGIADPNEVEGLTDSEGDGLTAVFGQVDLSSLPTTCVYTAWLDSDKDIAAAVVDPRIIPTATNLYGAMVAGVYGQDTGEETPPGMHVLFSTVGVAAGPKWYCKVFAIKPRGNPAETPVEEPAPEPEPEPEP